MEKHVKYRISNSYCWKIYSGTCVWKDNDLERSIYAMQECCRHSWKNLMFPSIQTLFSPLGIFWSRYWLGEYYSGEYQSQSHFKSNEEFFAVSLWKLPKYELLYTSLKYSLVLGILDCTSNTLLKMRMNCRQELVERLWMYHSSSFWEHVVWQGTNGFCTSFRFALIRHIVLFLPYTMGTAQA